MTLKIMDWLFQKKVFIEKYSLEQENYLKSCFYSSDWFLSILTIKI